MSVDRRKVAVAFIRLGDTFLISQRQPHGSFPLLWELPGGECEPEEDPAVCVIREIREETALAVRIAAGPVVVEHDYESFVVEIHAFLCRILEGTPAPLESVDLRWIRWEEIPRFAFPEANWKVFLEARPLWDSNP